jgi:hypothetical protein
MSSLSIKLAVAKALKEEPVLSDSPLIPPVYLDHVLTVAKTVIPLELHCAHGNLLPVDECGAIDLFKNVDPDVHQYIPEYGLPDAAIVISRDGKTHETTLVQDPHHSKDWRKNMHQEAEQLLKDSCKKMGCENGTNCAFTRKER